MDREKYPTIFHIDIDAFFASVEEALCPELKGKPLVVGGLPNERGIVSCPNYEARRLGVKTAMSISQAFRIAPNATFVRGHYREYERYSRRFIEILRDFSPVVQPVSLDEAFLDSNGCLHFWNFEPGKLAGAIKSSIRNELKITVSIGIASYKLCAKVASDFSKNPNEGSRGRESAAPDGLFIVPLGGETEFLAPLPVSAIPGIGMRTAEAMKQIGIRTVGDLASTNPDSLKNRFGVVGTLLHDAANGLGNYELPIHQRDARSISRSTTFAEDSADIGYISSIFFLLSEKIAASLRKLNLTASTITTRMRYSHGAPLLGFPNRSSPDMAQDDRAERGFVTYQKSHTVADSTNSEFEIASAAMELFEKLWLNGSEVRYVGIEVTGLREECVQFDLFGQARMKKADLLKGIDLLRDKFGYDSIYFGIVDRLERKCVDDHHGIAMHPPLDGKGNRYS